MLFNLVFTVLEIFLCQHQLGSIRVTFVCSHMSENHHKSHDKECTYVNVVWLQAAILG